MAKEVTLGKSDVKVFPIALGYKCSWWTQLISKFR